MPIRLSRRWRRIALGLAAAALAHGAPGRRRHARSARAAAAEVRSRNAPPATWPIPPGLLPAASWQRLIDNLPRHFGTDASLDAATAKELSTWLAAHAGTDKRAREAPPEDRITRSAWFIREHDEVRCRHLEAAGGEERRQLRGLPYPSRPRRFQ